MFTLHHIAMTYELYLVHVWLSISRPLYFVCLFFLPKTSECVNENSTFCLDFVYQISLVHTSISNTLMNTV